jgi:hypothetical protein
MRKHFFTDKDFRRAYLLMTTLTGFDMLRHKQGVFTFSLLSTEILSFLAAAVVVIGRNLNLASGC